MSVSESSTGRQFDRFAAALQRRPWAPTAVVALLGVAAMGGGVFLHPLTLAVGSAYTEALGHLWGLWCTAQGLFQHGPFLRVAEISYPNGFASHLMDPVNLVVFLPFYWLAGGGPMGAALGWNALHASTAVIGAYGCWKLGNRLVGDHPAAPWGIALMALVFCMSPYLLQVPFMGRTEYLPAVLYPWHLALLHEWLRLPVGLGGATGKAPPALAPAPRWTVGVGAGLVLGGIALGGWYLAVFIFLLEAPISLWLARRLPWREAAWRLGVVAGVGVLCALPAAITLVKYPPDGGDRFFNATGASRQLNITNYPVSSMAEVVRLENRRDKPQWMDQSPYVGVFALWLGVIGTAIYRRHAVGWFALTLWALWLSFGPQMLIRLPPPGTLDAVSLRTPTYWLLTFVEDLRPLRTWTRMAVLAALPAAVAAMYGLLALAPVRRRYQVLMAVPIMALFLADQSTWPKYYEFERPSMATAAPEGLMTVLSALPEGPVINFPIDTALREGGGPESHGHYLLWQLHHHRPVPTSFSGVYDTTLEHSVLTRMAAYVSYMNVSARGSLDPTVELHGYVPSASAEEIDCARADVPDLVARGYAAATLQLDLAGSAGLADFLVPVLGEPQATGLNAMGWDLRKVPASRRALSDCELPKVAGKLVKRGG